MMDFNRATLLNLLLAGYDDLKSRLARRLGSSDLAQEVMQDTFLRVSTAPQMGPIRSPRAYLFRIAMSVATKRLIAERRRFTRSVNDSLFEFVDDAPDPARIVEARSDIEELKRAMSELSTRRRQILIAACMDEVPYQDIAKRFNVTVRTVQIELKEALAHCADRLHRNIPKRAASRHHRSFLSGSIKTRKIESHGTNTPASGFDFEAKADIQDVAESEVLS